MEMSDLVCSDWNICNHFWKLSLLIGRIGQPGQPGIFIVPFLQTGLLRFFSLVDFHLCVGLWKGIKNDESCFSLLHWFDWKCSIFLGQSCWCLIGWSGKMEITQYFYFYSHVIFTFHY